jgi:hypothetical protein
MQRNVEPTPLDPGQLRPLYIQSWSTLSAAGRAFALTPERGNIAVSLAHHCSMAFRIELTSSWSITAE